MPRADIPEQPDDVRAGLNRIEGYLLWQAEQDNARREAESFTAQMPWLTSVQRDEVVRLYTRQRLIVARQTLQRVADRCHELQAEYTDRYNRYRQRFLSRLTALALLSLVMAAFLLWAGQSS